MACILNILIWGLVIRSATVPDFGTGNDTESCCPTTSLEVLHYGYGLAFLPKLLNAAILQPNAE